ncbi:MAG: hypothetical protein L0229_04265, partial [Blastocatellia bacterium]|nr:hypothetical protein [Blastocatellia bacterium]
VTTDNGNLKQQFCFAYQEGKLIVTTTEGLMIRALANARQPGEDSLQADVLATATLAGGFTAHEIVIWLDQAQLNKNLYFNNYWIHRNTGERAPSSLARIESGLIDVRLTPQGLSEQRWFKLASSSAQTGALTAEQTAALTAFAPADAQLVEIHAQGESGEKLEEAVARTLFGKLKEGTWSPADIPDRTRYMRTEGSTSRTERYRRLDSRFDRDVDDEHAPGKALPHGRATENVRAAPSQESGFTDKAASVFAALSPVGYCCVARSRASAGTPFVSFERAIIIETANINALDRAAMEQAIGDELRARFVVSGIDPQIEWRDEAGGSPAPVRYVAQSLLEQGAAYAVSGKYLVLASSREFARDILRSAAAPAAPQRIDGPAEFYALVRVAASRPVFDTLMSKLDGKTAEAPESGSDVKFFSGNLSSLVAASAIREVRIRRETNGALMVERLVYSW